MSAGQDWISIYREGGRHFFGRIENATEEDAIQTAKLGESDRYVLAGVVPEQFARAGGWSSVLPRPKFDEMSEQALKAWAAHKARQAQPAAGAHVKPAPQLPPEVWQSQPADADRAMAAVRAMCGSAS